MTHIINKEMRFNPEPQAPDTLAQRLFKYGSSFAFTRDFCQDNGFKFAQKKRDNRDLVFGPESGNGLNT